MAQDRSMLRSVQLAAVSLCADAVLTARTGFPLSAMAGTQARHAQLQREAVIAEAGAQAALRRKVPDLGTAERQTTAAAGYRRSGLELRGRSVGSLAPSLREGLGRLLSTALMEVAEEEATIQFATKGLQRARR
jgi:hypothetical protein